MLTKKEKSECIKKTCLHKEDTGSGGAQISIISERINQLSNHLKTNKKDKHSRRGLVMLVEKRRKHLSYLRITNNEYYKKILSTLGLKK